jgi:putative flippase GtrA
MFHFIIKFTKNIIKHYDAKEVMKSSISSIFSTIIYLLVAYLFDMILNPNISNGIGLLTGAVINYVGQGIAFQDKQHREYNLKNLSKYMLVEILVLSLDEGLFIIGVETGLIKHQKEYIVTIIRLSITTIIFFIMSYPLRKYWVFHNNNYYITIGTNDNEIQMVTISAMESSMNTINNIFMEIDKNENENKNNIPKYLNEQNNNSDLEEYDFV